MFRMVREVVKEDLDALLELYLFLHEDSIPVHDKHLEKTWDQIPIRLIPLQTQSLQTERLMLLMLVQLIKYKRNEGEHEKAFMFTLLPILFNWM